MSASRRLSVAVTLSVTAIIACILFQLPLPAAAAPQEIPAVQPATAPDAPLVIDGQSTGVPSGTVVAWGSNWQGQTNIPAGLSGVTALAAGGWYSMALKSNGTVVAWGDNNYGQTNVPAGLNGVTAIASGYNHSVALKGDGTVVAWGINTFGQSTVPAGLSNVAAIAAAHSHTLALKSDGTLVAWGENFWGQLDIPAEATGVAAIAAAGLHSVALKSDGTVVTWGDGSHDQLNVPPGLNHVTAVAAGNYHSLALKSDGTVVAWGGNAYGEATVPPGLTGVTAIAARGYHSLALKSDGTIVAWGDNSYGQGNLPGGLTGITAIAAGGYHSLAIKSDSPVVAWGVNDYGQSTVPAGLHGIAAITGGFAHSLALRSDGRVVAWGWDNYDQATVPDDLNGVKAVAGGVWHSLALRSDGSVVAWGTNGDGQTAVPDEAKSRVTAIAAGAFHSMALRSDGRVVAWGWNYHDQIDVPSEAQSGVTAISAGYGHSLALKSDGTVVSWGSNEYGQRNVPDDAKSGVTAIAAGYGHILALKSGGTVVAWGRNDYGQATVPAGLSGVSAVAAGDFFSLALKSDGTVVAWGRNDYGQATVPAGLSGVAAIAGGGYHNLAVGFLPTSIAVDPAALTSTQQSSAVRQETLNITNNGGLDLTWTITVENGSAAACDGSAGAPGWATASPASGTTTWGTTAPVAVTFNAARLSVGTYNATLCVASNDPTPGPGNGTALVKVPLTLTVDAPRHWYVAKTGADTNEGTEGAPLLTIQKAIDSAANGDTIHVAAGVYGERLNLNMSVTLLGAQSGVDPVPTGARANPAAESVIDIAGLPVTNPNVAVEIPSGVSGVTVDGFTLIGSPTSNYADEAVVRAWSDNITLRNNIVSGYYGYLYKGSSGGMSATRNRITAQKVGVTVQPNPAANVVIGNNSIVPGSSPASDAAAVYLTNCTDCSVTGNTLTGFSGSNGVGGSNETRLTISGNTISGCKKGINHWGNTTFVTISGNAITGSAEKGIEIKGQDLTISNNTITGNPVGVYIGKHTLETQRVNLSGNNLSGNTSYGLQVDAAVVEVVFAENNWWGAACGPNTPGASQVSGLAYHAPWWSTPTGDPISGGTTATSGMTAAQQSAIINCAASGTTITYGFGTYPGGVVIENNGVTIDLSGSTVGPGSPAFTITADDVTIQNVVLDGAGDVDGSPAVKVEAGADNFTLQDADVRNWVDGVQIAGPVTSFKLVNNYIHQNTGAGLRVNGAIGGVASVEGNLFKNNGGPAIASVVQPAQVGTKLPAHWNSFATTVCPTYPNVDTTNCAFAETFIDVDPTIAGDQFARNIIESQEFDVKVMMDAQNLYGYAFRFVYTKTKLLKGAVTPTPPTGYSCMPLPAGDLVDDDVNGLGYIGYQCAATTTAAMNGLTPVLTVHFTATGPGLTGNGPWEAYFDVDDVKTTAGTANGALVYLNNVKLAGDTTNERAITDTNDGQIYITGIGKFTGFIDVQGRADDSGALLEVFSANTLDAPALASAMSAKGGAYTTAYVDSNLLTIGTPYFFKVDKPRYVKTWSLPVVAPHTVPMAWLNTRPLTTLSILVLMGGDANDNDTVDVNDAGLIGGQYGATPTCPLTGSCADVNGDGKVDILDLTLMGGNYGIAGSDWTP